MMSQETSGQDQKADREGMIKVNDLVYKLEPDISVAVNRTHKTHYFQQPEYKSSQTAVCILNSGADYIDCRRSFLTLRINLSSNPHELADSDFDAWHADDTYTKTAARAFNHNLLVHGYFGPNGSILNLIDTVTVTTRSGDELSRVQDLALLANMTLPLLFGDDWKGTVGEMMGMGDCVYGQSSARKHPAADRTFAIPMYLLSPLFQYGRLMPSMLMSGLRITITWKPAEKAFAQFVAKCPENNMPVNIGGFVAGCGFNETGHQLLESREIHSAASGDLPHEFKAEITVTTLKLAPPCPRNSRYAWQPGDIAVVAGVNYIVANQTDDATCTLVRVGAANFDLVDSTADAYRIRPASVVDTIANNPLRGGPTWDPTANLADTVIYTQLNTIGTQVPSQDQKDEAARYRYETSLQRTFCPSDGHRADGYGLAKGESGVEYTWPVHTLEYPKGKNVDKELPDYWGTGVESREPTKRMSFPAQFTSGTLVPNYKYKGPDKNVRPFFAVSDDDITNSPALRRNPMSRKKYYKNPDFVTEYQVVRPELSLCSVQLSDAIQRTLNEYSAVNGLEIVYTDYDLTHSPVTAVPSGTSVYTEVRKSASRALQAFARMVPMYTDADVRRTSDSNASTIQYAEDLQTGGKGWMDYQWQLGSLYFPQQKVSATGAYDMASLAYAHTLDAFDRFSGVVSCMLPLTGKKRDKQKIGLTRMLTLQNWTQIPGAAPPDLLSQERLYVLGKPGSFQGGGEVISVSLERSSLFNLSGIPINNSRVLAIRGQYSSVPTWYCQGHTLNIYLKYVKLARIFLNNVEVEQ
jgi:hypothetical protein